MGWWRKRPQPEAPGAVEGRVRRKYSSFRDLLSLNNECLELMAGLQEDLQYVPPLRDLLDERVSAFFQKVEAVVATLEGLASVRHEKLRLAIQEQRAEVERYIAAAQEGEAPRLSARLSELSAGSVAEAGGKAAALGEVKTKLGLPVPDGYVLTTEAYRRFCGIPLWPAIRSALREASLEDLEALKAASAALAELILAAPLPRAVEIAIAERARTLKTFGLGLAVRSSAVGEGGERSFAGQFESLLSVPPEQAVEAYKRVVAGRFSEKALCYRLSTALFEVESPMAVLVLPMLPVRAAGILYTRDPKDPDSRTLWITSTLGVGAEIASGRMPADLFVLSRRRPHQVLERHLVRKEDPLVAVPSGGLARQPLEDADREAPSLPPAPLQALAEWALRIEEHFRRPQDVEWVLDTAGKLWIVQTRPLVVAEPGESRTRLRTRAEPLLAGGRLVYPGRVSGPAHLIEAPGSLDKTPPGAILFLRKAAPEITPVFPRIAGLVAEVGNVAGHAAALLREFKIPSVFQMSGAFEKLNTGQLVSLDAIQQAVYSGALWPPRRPLGLLTAAPRERTDAISRRLLTLNLIDPAASNFRPAGCQSAHDILRYCHEKSVEAMFAVNDFALEQSPHNSRQLLTPVPVNIHVLDLGGGLALTDSASPQVRPAEIVSRPFQALWRGISHPEVSWRREIRAGLSDWASVMATALAPQSGVMRALGDRSYLLVADEYMNLNSRLAYHFSLVDACLSDTPSNNYIAFRFAGGGATRHRRNLRAAFIAACLIHYGFTVDRRGDLVNAWYKKAPAAQTETNLDILGRLMACSGQLDMYMTSEEVMKWYVRQFLEGNYSLRAAEDREAT